MVRLSIITLSLLSAITSIHALPNLPVVPRQTRGGLGCGTEPSKEFLASVQEVAAIESAVRLDGNATEIDPDTRRAAVIDTYVHVVARSTALSGGYVPQSQITQQIAIMNQHYAGTGYSFRLVSTDYTVNTAWASDANGNDLTMKRALRKGTYKALNLYFQYSVSGYLGYCQFPTNAASGSTAFYKDGCNILYTTTPGGSLTNYNLGGTATHEVGHWMGLLHVFQGGCSGSGDGIADTPPQSIATDGCPTGQDSCSGGGVDSIHNYMDYSYDACYEEFTPNQITRMNTYWNTYRA